jgi:ABC-type glycerol-3-phosphate transport system permease component
MARVAGRAAVWAWLLVSMIPFVFMLVTAFKPEGIALSVPPDWTFTPTLENFTKVLSGDTGSGEPFGTLVVHSVVVASLSTLLAVAVGLPAAYALAQPRFRPRRGLANWILSTIMFPPVVAVIPVFVIAGKMQLLDTLPVLVIPYAAFNLPMVIWILRSTIRQVPEEIEQAALVDGATRRAVLVRIILPLVAPGIATAAILCAVLSWNEFLFALSLTRSGAKTAPVGLQQFTGMYGTDWGNITSAATLIVAPILVLMIILRRQMVAGLSFGAVK